MLQRVDHIGVYFDDLAEAKRFLGEAFQLDLQREIELTNPERRAAFYRCGDVDVEVIELTDPDQRNERLRGQQAVIDHIAIQVDDLKQTVAVLERLGVRSALGPIRVGRNVSVWTDPPSSDGVSYQLTEKG